MAGLRKANRTSWIWCPQCRRDLNGDDASLVSDADTVRYTCATCGFNSEFLLDAPVPIYLGVWS